MANHRVRRPDGPGDAKHAPGISTAAGRERRPRGRRCCRWKAERERAGGTMRAACPTHREIQRDQIKESGEESGGEEGGRQCRVRGEPHHKKKQTRTYMNGIEKTRR